MIFSASCRGAVGRAPPDKGAMVGRAGLRLKTRNRGMLEQIGASPRRRPDQPIAAGGLE